MEPILIELVDKTEGGTNKTVPTKTNHFYVNMDKVLDVGLLELVSGDKNQLTIIAQESMSEKMLIICSDVDVL